MCRTVASVAVVTSTLMIGIGNAYAVGGIDDLDVTIRVVDVEDRDSSEYINRIRLPGHVAEAAKERAEDRRAQDRDERREVGDAEPRRGEERSHARRRDEHGREVRERARKLRDLRDEDADWERHRRAVSELVERASARREEANEITEQVEATREHQETVVEELRDEMRESVTDQTDEMREETSEHMDEMSER